MQVKKRKSSEEKSFKVPQPHEFLKMRPTSQVQKNKSCNVRVKDPVVFQIQNEMISLLISYHCAAAKLSLVAERVRSAAMAISTIQTVQVSKAHIREIIKKQL